MTTQHDEIAELAIVLRAKVIAGIDEAIVPLVKACEERLKILQAGIDGTRYGAQSTSRAPMAEDEYDASLRKIAEAAAALKEKDARDAAERERQQKDDAEQLRLQQEREKLAEDFLGSLKVAIEITNKGISETGRNFQIVPDARPVDGLIRSFMVRLVNDTSDTGYELEFDMDLKGMVRVKLPFGTGLEAREFPARNPHLHLVKALTDVLFAAAKD